MFILCCSGLFKTLNNAVLFSIKQFSLNCEK
uniref:Uncharacterized protein n=1 Tax=Anguilla anguilla TaxID=7936 RepID=A0A0E9XMD1_ANGAN